MRTLTNWNKHTHCTELSRNANRIVVIETNVIGKWNPPRMTIGNSTNLTLTPKWLNEFYMFLEFWLNLKNFTFHQKLFYRLKSGLIYQKALIISSKSRAKQKKTNNLKKKCVLISRNAVWCLKNRNERKKKKTIKIAQIVCNWTILSGMCLQAYSLK